MTRVPAASCLAPGLLVALLFTMAADAQAGPAAFEADSLATPASVMPQMSGPPRLDLSGFFDVGMTASRQRSAGKDSSALDFSLGQFDLYMRSRLSDRMAFLGELVIESDESGSSRIELERAHLRYRFSDWADLTVGRTHSPISYWNIVYHHGALLEPTIERPAAVAFEDEGGMLPLHAVGLEFGGALQASRARIRYVVSLANGRGDTPDRILQSGDSDRDKALGLSLAADLDEPLEVRLGAALYHDRLPSTPARTERLAQDISSVHLVVKSGWCEAISEYFRVRDRSASAEFRHEAWYVVVSAGHARVQPYMSAAHTRADALDPYFLGGLTTSQSVSGGLRLEITGSNVLKLEYRRSLRSGIHSHDLALQTAFTF